MGQHGTWYMVRYMVLPQTNSTRNAESLGLSPKLTADRIHGGQLPGIAWRMD